MDEIRAGAHADREHVVGPDDTAHALGSGDLPVLATPRLLAWCEAATCAALELSLDPAETGVGVRVDLRHVAPSALGETVRVRAEVVAVDGRAVTFDVVATDRHEREVARGEVERVVVDRARFLDRLGLADG